MFTACDITHQRCCLLVTTLSPTGSIAGPLYHKLQTESSAPVDGRNYRPKHVELIVIINKVCYFCIYLVVYIIVSTINGHTNVKKKIIFLMPLFLFRFEMRQCFCSIVPFFATVLSRQPVRCPCMLLSTAGLDIT